MIETDQHEEKRKEKMGERKKDKIGGSWGEKEEIGGERKKLGKKTGEIGEKEEIGGEEKNGGKLGEGEKVKLGEMGEK